MPYQVFVIPSRGDAAAEAELNAFLRRHCVMSADRRWVEQGVDSFWSVCVDYLERAPAGSSSARSGKSRARVDYREVLGPAGHVLYERLRELRTELSAQDHVPPYLVFNNDQLAQMIQEKSRSTSLAAFTMAAGAKSWHYRRAVLKRCPVSGR